MAGNGSSRTTGSAVGTLGKSLAHKSVVVTVTGRGGSYTTVLTTDYHGHAALGAVPLPAGTYLVSLRAGDTRVVHKLLLLP